MAIGLTDDQRSLAGALTDWAKDAGTVELIREADRNRSRDFGDTWGRLTHLGVASIALPESVGGAGGSLVDLACALEACARGLVPGPLLSTAVAATLLAEHPETAAARVLPRIVDGSVSVALALEPASLTRSDTGALSGRVPVVWDAGATTHLLLGAGSGGDEHWFLLDMAEAGVSVDPAPGVDLSRAVGSVRLDEVAGADVQVPLSSARVQDVAVTLAAAELSGVARWTLDTAVDHAKVREQFGRKIGSFQAVKHLCAQMLETAESATAVAWDAASAYADSGDQFGLAAAVAGSVALDAAVSNAKDCIQVLGGIGFTWEHDAHLYLRRALSVSQLLGGADRWRLRAADHALEGVRRSVRIDLGGQDEQVRSRVREEVREIAARRGADRRTAMADAGLIAPHWPPPYGRGAGPVEQIVIDQEFAEAGVSRPDLSIGAWAAPTILGHGTDEQRDRFVGPTLRGDLSWCQLFSEPGAGSDLASLRTRAERADGGWRLSGQKVWTSLAKEADWAICLARTNPDVPQHKGITYFLV
ncbi:MAG: acyl-CoA dehydrogenase, partial [Nocardioidaceae bacterium]